MSGATEADARARSARYRRGRASWEARVRHEAQRLRADLDCAAAAAAVPTTTTTATPSRSAADSERIKRINEHLDHADYLLDEHFSRRWPVRLATASRVYQDALASVYRASEDLLLIQDDDAVAARLPGLRAAVRSYLSADDARREIYLLRIDAVLTSVGAERLAAAARFAEVARSAAHAEAQRSEGHGEGADSKSGGM